MNSRERVNFALNHREPDRIPLDLGGTPVSGMHVSSVYLLRLANAPCHPSRHDRLQG